MYKVQWVQKERRSQVYLRAEDAWSLLWWKKTGAGDERYKKSKLRKCGQSLLPSSLFSVLAWFLSVLLGTILVDTLSRWFPPCQLSPHLVCSGPSDTQEEGYAWPSSLSIVLKIERGSMSTTSKNCRQLHNSGQHVSLWSLVVAFYNSIYEMY